ncbi:MAG: hypothetical protein KA053_04440 [Lentimicrobiaceae bacterium]|nr:hypothetical protein [Lentimicrobiaceae bacterium]
MLLKGIRLLLPLMALAGLVFISSCEKENKDMEAVITVRYLGDTTKVVPYARVFLQKNAISVEGVTDLSGQFRHTFKLEAILDVLATIDTGSNGGHTTLTGSTVIRLKPGKSEERTVYLSE